MSTEELRLEQLQKMVSDKDVTDIFHGTNFGKQRDRRKIIADTLLKFAGGFSSGHTALICCIELGLLLKRKDNKIFLTKKGRRYLFWSHTS